MHLNLNLLIPKKIRDNRPFKIFLLRNSQYLGTSRLYSILVIDLSSNLFVCLFVVYRHSQEFFIPIETPPLPVKGCKFWPTMSCKGPFGYYTVFDTGFIVISEYPWRCHLLHRDCLSGPGIRTHDLPHGSEFSFPTVPLQRPLIKLVHCASSIWPKKNNLYTTEYSLYWKTNNGKIKQCISK